MDLWQQVLTETGFSGIDFTVRDCEDDELYAMRVILSTAVPGTESTTNRSSDLRLISSSQSQCSGIAQSLQEHTGMPCNMTTVEAEDFSRIENDSSYLMAIGDDWASPEIQKLTNSLGKYKGALLVSAERPGQVALDNASDELSHMLRTSHPKKSIVSVRLGSDVRIDDNRTLVAIAKVFKASVYEVPVGRHDQEYFLTPSQVYTPRISPFSLPLEYGNECGKLKQNELYIIRGRSTSLITATCKLLASLGARSILIVLIVPDGDDGSSLRSVEQFAHTLVKTNCQVTSTTLEAMPEVRGSVAGIIDFGDVREVLNPETPLSSVN